MWGIAIWLLKQLQILLKATSDDIVSRVSGDVVGVQIVFEDLPNDPKDGRIYIVTENLQ